MLHNNKFYELTVSKSLPGEKRDKPQRFTFVQSARYHNVPIGQILELCI